MDITTIRKTLSNGDNDVAATTFCNYLMRLSLEKKDNQVVNWWIAGLDNNILIDAYNKVKDQSMYIDGDIITLSFRSNKLLIDFSYQAYRSKLMDTYPETIIDYQCVKQSDIFDFKKENGAVVYSHKFGNPFKKESTVGAYCVIKNRRGEFIELLTRDEAMVMKDVAKTKTIWNKWEDRMFLKSVIKRVCKTMFYDSFKGIENIDNENYDLAQVDSEKPQLEELSKENVKIWDRAVEKIGEVGFDKAVAIMEKHYTLSEITKSTLKDEANKA